MDTPHDICNKYCKQRLQKLVDDKACPFSLVSSETEMVMGELSIKTVCEGFISTAFKTIIERISKVTKTGIEIVKEIIKHEKQTTYRDSIGIDETMKIPNINIPYTPPILPQYPGLTGTGNVPWVYTTSINSLSSTTYTDTETGDTK